MKQENEEQVEPRSNFYRKGFFYIYGYIDETIPECIIAPMIEEITNRARLAPNARPPITIYICSYGGYVDYAFDLIALFEMAKQMGVMIETVVLSQACSAASLIAVSGHRRLASSRASHLMHFARSFSYSHNPEMAERNMEYDKFLQGEIVKIYKEKTKIKDIDKKMLADNFIVSGGKKLKELGLIDEIV